MANFKDYKDFYKYNGFIQKEIFGGFERDKVKNFALLDEKNGRFVYRF